MQSQTAFYYIGQVLTVDLCFRLARLALNLVYLVRLKVVSYSQLSFVGQCNRMGLKIEMCTRPHFAKGR